MSVKEKSRLSQMADERSNALKGQASLTFGIFSLVMCLTISPLVGIFFVIPSILVGLPGLSASRRRNAIFGLACSAITVLIYILCL